MSSPSHIKGVPAKKYYVVYYKLRRKKIIDYLGGVCVACDSTIDLEVDHKNPTEKSFNISRRLALTDSNKKEFDKCQLLCKNCHRAKTAKENAGWTHGTSTGWLRKKCKCVLCTKAYIAWKQRRNAARRTNVRGPYRPRIAIIQTSAPLA